METTMVEITEVETVTHNICDVIAVGDRVTILNRFGQERTGRAVMRGSAYHWVLNMGGPHGTPAVATNDNIVRVKKARTPRAA